MINGSIPGMLAAEFAIILPTWAVRVVLGIAAVVALVVLVVILIVRRKS